MNQIKSIREISGDTNQHVLKVTQIQYKCRIANFRTIVFSSQKRNKSDVRGFLHVDKVEDLIRITLEGTSLEEVNAKEAEQMSFSQLQGLALRGALGGCALKKGGGGVCIL